MVSTHSTTHGAHVKWSDTWKQYVSCDRLQIFGLYLIHCFEFIWRRGSWILVKTAAAGNFARDQMCIVSLVKGLHQQDIHHTLDVYTATNAKVKEKRKTESILSQSFYLFNLVLFFPPPQPPLCRTGLSRNEMRSFWDGAELTLLGDGASVSVKTKTIFECLYRCSYKLMYEYNTLHLCQNGLKWTCTPTIMPC